MLNNSLLTIIRILWIVLLVLAIGAVVKTFTVIGEVNKRVDQFDTLLQGFTAQPLQAVNSDEKHLLEEPIEQQSKNAQLMQLLFAAQTSFMQNNPSQGRAQLLELNRRLKEQELTDAEQINAQLIAAIDAGDGILAQQLGQQLAQMLS